MSCSPTPWAAMGWIDVNALQVGHPDRMDAARTAEAPDE